jgi:hypothetical protein
MLMERALIRRVLGRPVESFDKTFKPWAGVNVQEQVEEFWSERRSKEGEVIHELTSGKARNLIDHMMHRKFTGTG